MKRLNVEHWLTEELLKGLIVRIGTLESAVLQLEREAALFDFHRDEVSR